MKSSTKDRVIDALLITMMILPFLGAMALNILTKPLSEGITVTGAQIYFTIDMPLQPLYITEAQVVSVAVVIALLGLCLFLTRKLSIRPISKRQVIAEMIVETMDKLVAGNMGQRFMGFAPFIAAILGLSALSSLCSLLGLFPPTSDINIVAGWAILVFILITYYKCKCGPWYYIKSFGDPVAVLAPMNVISEVATPFSMAFRHYGNILSGSIVSVLVAAALQGLSSMLLGQLPGFLGEFPFLRIGIPALLSIYFDVFSACLQAYIFAVLTMLYVSSAFPQDEYEKRKLKKQQKKAQTNS